MENPYTLYRLLAPVGLLAVFLLRPMLVLRLSAFFLIFFAYNLTLALAYSPDLTQFFPSIVHYLYLFVLLVLMIFMKMEDVDFKRSFILFVQAFYLFLLLNLLIEYIFGPFYPNLYVDQSDEKSLRAFFWNQNDLAVVLCVVGWFALTLDSFRGPIRIIVVLLTVALLYYNDSKAALISFLLVSVPVSGIFRICSAVHIKPRVWFVFFGLISIVAVSTIFVFSDVNIAFENDTYTLGDLLLKPLISIFNLQASGEALGSLNNRTDAAIFVIVEYMRSLGFGLGAGGSWLVLTLPQYELGGAQSPHNALLQFTVDFGYPVLLGSIYLLYWAIRNLFTYRLDENTRLKVMAILSFPMLGLSQSGAIVTNYFFFAAVYFVFLLDRPAPFANPSPIVQRLAAASGLEPSR